MATANGSSWMALLASTILGDVGADTVHTEVRAELPGAATDQRFRLVVQTYDAKDGNPPRRGARPIGSTQRSVTAAELRQGVAVSLVELQSSASATRELPVVVAWIDDADVDVEFDGRMARPLAGCLYGSARRSGSDRVAVSLKKRVA
jgi:hypothetical protein